VIVENMDNIHGEKLEKKIKFWNCATWRKSLGKQRVTVPKANYRSADKSLARPGRKQTRKHVKDARHLNNIEKRAVKFFFFLQGKTPKEFHAILTETLACFLPGRTKDLINTPVISNGFCSQSEKSINKLPVK